MSRRVKYICNPTGTILGPRSYPLKPAGVERAAHRTRKIIGELAGLEIDIFALLGMRNLSAFVGEIFAASMVHEHDAVFRKNPHQDGYPDLLLLDKTGQGEWDRLKGQLREKKPFSPFASGGFEVKATCGDVPTPEECQSRGLEKPHLGDQRVALLRGYNWKAHHRKTNYLLGIFWDFVNGLPTIVAVFYSNALTTADWGKLVKPRTSGGRTTSVSIMKRSGVQKMYDGWVLVIDSEQYAEFFDARNKSTAIADSLSRRRSR